jgi:hypothetical protein
VGLPPYIRRKKKKEKKWDMGKGMKGMENEEKEYEEKWDLRLGCGKWGNEWASKKKSGDRCGGMSSPLRL